LRVAKRLPTWNDNPTQAKRSNGNVITNLIPDTAHPLRINMLIEEYTTAATARTQRSFILSGVAADIEFTSTSNNYPCRIFGSHPADPLPLVMLTQQCDIQTISLPMRYLQL